MTQPFLNDAIEHAYTFLSAVDGNAALLPEPMRTVVIVSTAQGIIDNGGLEYFFESDFPHNPPYSLFVEAFRRIGADGVSTCIERCADMFPFAHPHLHEAQRQQWIDSIKDNEAHEFVLLSNKACGDKVVYKKLAEFVERNRNSFEAVNTSKVRDSTRGPSNL
ncbi:DMP19 family protein [Massilia consociata]|uniref:DUF4375 domain-containing protein n=1 Tax=Massilia consociata TaxID=760117 RepID=A0ABV6FDS3_9BURK